MGLSYLHACASRRPAWQVAWLGWLALGILLSGCAATTRLSPDQVADGIQNRYESELDTLPALKQRHYAQRLFRITGDARYLPLNRQYANRLLEDVSADIEGLRRPGHAAVRSQMLITAYPTRTQKQRERKQLLAGWGEIAFARSLLFRLAQLKYYGLLTDEHLPGHSRALAYLDSVDFATFLSHPEVISKYAAQIANIVHFLYQLDIVDLREPVIAAFRAHYSQDKEEVLSTEAFHNMLYGLTHFVIADSRYYQRKVGLEDHAWVFDAFERHRFRLLDEATEDILAEVGISYRLAGLDAHPLLSSARASLVGAYRPDVGMIPSPTGDTDLVRGEHRNVLALMLLRWPQRLHPGPDLSKDPAITRPAALRQDALGSAEAQEAIGVEPEVYEDARHVAEEDDRRPAQVAHERVRAPRLSHHRNAGRRTDRQQAAAHARGQRNQQPMAM